MNHPETLNNHQQQAEAVEKLAATARKHILIFSHQLEPYLYNQQGFVSYCKTMVIRHPHSHIRLMIQNNEKLRGIEHRLLTLMHRLPSRITLKKCHQDYQDYPETFMLTDNSGIYLKRTPGRTNATMQMDNRRLNDEYSRLFTTIWDQSDFDATLRQLSL